MRLCIRKILFMEVIFWKSKTLFFFCTWITTLIQNDRGWFRKKTDRQEGWGQMCVFTWFSSCAFCIRCVTTHSCSGPPLHPCTPARCAVRTPQRWGSLPSRDLQEQALGHSAEESAVTAGSMISTVDAGSELPLFFVLYSEREKLNNKKERDKRSPGSIEYTVNLIWDYCCSKQSLLLEV